MLGIFKKEHLQFLKFAHKHRIKIDPKLRYVGIFFISAAYFFLAFSTVLFQKSSLDYPIFEIFFLQFLTVFVVYFFILFARGKGLSAFKTKETNLVFSRGIVAIITYFAYFSSKIWVDIVDNSLLFSIDALIIPLMMYFFFRVYIPRFAVVGLLIGFLGVSFVNAFDFRVSSWGGLIGIFSGIGLAYIVVITSYMVKNDSPLIIGFYQSLIGVIFSALIMLYFEWKAPNFMDLISIISQGALFAIALFLFLDAFYYTEAHIIGSLGYTLTIFIIFLEALILGRIINISSLIGTVLVCGGGLTVIGSTYRQDKLQHLSK